MMMSDSRGLRAAGGAVRFVCRGGLMWRAAVSACLPACLPALTAFVNAHLAPSLCGPPASGAAENQKKKKMRRRGADTNHRFNRPSKR